MLEEVSIECKHVNNGCSYRFKSNTQYEEHLKSKCHFERDIREKEELRCQISQLYVLLHDLKQQPVVAPVPVASEQPTDLCLMTPKREEIPTFYVVSERSSKAYGYNISQWVVNYLKQVITNVRFVETNDYVNPCILVIPAVTKRNLKKLETLLFDVNRKRTVLFSCCSYLFVSISCSNNQVSLW